MLYIGLISGTSADGINGALVEVVNDGFRLIATRSRSHSPDVKSSIESVIELYPNVEQADIARLDERLAADFARLAMELIEERHSPADITAIGSHGQTVYHGPADDPPVTIQLGNPQRIADLTGVTTVGDFRTNDLKAGGQGAPLAPAFHNAMFRRPGGASRMIVNIGGIANVTSLPAERSGAVLGFDTGPGNTLMDRWCHAHTGELYDMDGHWASCGRPRERFVEALLSDPYFAAPPPKSTGREYFHLDWMKTRYPTWRDEEPADIQAGLLEVTARSIVQAINGICGEEVCETYICGGGARNPALMSRLAALSAGPVSTTEALGLSPEWVEACAFAWLAHRRIQGRPGNLPSVTGASAAVLLGEIHAPAG